jgi:ABC-type antimicrobial peptide transport system ATPase subunit
MPDRHTGWYRRYNMEANLTLTCVKTKEGTLASRDRSKGSGKSTLCRC